MDKFLIISEGDKYYSIIREGVVGKIRELIKCALFWWWTSYHHHPPTHINGTAFTFIGQAHFVNAAAGSGFILHMI